MSYLINGCVVREMSEFNRGDGGSIPPAAVSKLANFVHLTLPVSFGRDTKSRWSLLYGVYARGCKRSHTFLEEENSENQARQYSSHKRVANID